MLCPSFIIHSSRLYNNTLCFIFAEENFISVTSLLDKRLTALSITAQLNHYREKTGQSPLWEEDSVKLAYMEESVSGKHCWRSKTMSKGFSGPRFTNTGLSCGIKPFELTNLSSKYFGQIVGFMCGGEFVKGLQPPISR